MCEVRWYLLEQNLINKTQSGWFGLQRAARCIRMRWHWWQPEVPSMGGCTCSEASSRFGQTGLGKRHVPLGLSFAFFIISSLPEYLKPLVAGDPLAQQGRSGEQWCTSWTWQTLQGWS